MINEIPKPYIDFKSKTGIGLGQIVFTKKPDRYCLLGIGTCIAAFIYDLVKMNFTMAHTVLPFQDDFINNRRSEKMPGKFVDQAIKRMLTALSERGSKRRDLKAKLVGGATIFVGSFNIGEDNIEAARTILKENKIPIIAEEVGGRRGRSVFSFNLDGSIEIRKQMKYYKI
jgi:chemotaxis protein CheD